MGPDAVKVGDTINKRNNYKNEQRHNFKQASKNSYARLRGAHDQSERKTAHINGLHCKDLHWAVWAALKWSVDGQ